MRRLDRTVCLLSIVALAVILLTGASASAKPPRSAFKPGDKVEVPWGNETLTGEVVQIAAGGFVRVRVTIHGHEFTPSFPPDKVHLVKKSSSAKKAKPGKESGDDQSEEGRGMRTWSDASGKHKIRAKFIELQDGKVRLKQSDGTTVAIPLAKLSEEDQKLAKQLSETGDDSPFEDAEPAEKNADAPAGREEKAVEDVPLGDWSQVETVIIDDSAGSSLTPDAITAERPKLRTVHMESLSMQKARETKAETVADVFYDRPRERLVIAYTPGSGLPGFHGQSDEEHRGPRIQACDLKTAHTVGAVTLDTPYPVVPTDLSPDGTSVVCVTHDMPFSHHQAKGYVEVWQLKKPTSLVKRWDARYAKQEHLPGDCHARFVSSETVLTTHKGEGRVTLWNVADSRAIYTVAARRNCVPALSANRKQVAIAYEGGLCVLDAATGNILAAYTVPLDKFGDLVMAFRDDGRQLAVISTDGLLVWDFAKKAIVAEVSLPKRMKCDSVVWVDDAYVLVNGSLLIDVPKQIAVWEYRTSPTVGRGAVVAGNLCYVVTLADAMAQRPSYARRLKPQDMLASVANVRGVYFVPLPHPEAVKAIEKIDPERLFAAKAGTAVSLDVRLASADPAETKKITDSLTAKLQENGMKVAAGAPVTLEAVVESGKTESRTYRNIGAFGRGPREETVNVTEKILRVAFKENGKVLWSRESRSGVSSFVHHEAGQSIADAVQKDQKFAGFFLMVRLPRQVARQGENGVFGASTLTPKGAVPVTTEKPE